MDLLQRYTRDDFYYELEEKFLEVLEELPVKHSASIIVQLDRAVVKMINKNKTQHTQTEFGTIVGVVNDNSPLYFSVNYLNYKNSYPLFYKLNIIDCDQYLDYINLRKTINHEPAKDTSFSV